MCVCVYTASQIKRRIDEKNKLLRAMAAGTGREAAFASVDMTEVNTAWESFTTQLQQFDAHLEEQKAQLAVAIGKQLDDFRRVFAHTHTYTPRARTCTHTHTQLLGYMRACAHSGVWGMCSSNAPECVLCDLPLLVMTLIVQLCGSDCDSASLSVNLCVY